MTIRVMRSVTNAFLSIVVEGEEDLAEFDKLISRGISTWDRATPEIKVAADLIRYGLVQQDYYTQAGAKMRPE